MVVSSIGQRQTMKLFALENCGESRNESWEQQTIDNLDQNQNMPN